MTSSAVVEPVVIRYHPRGAAADVFRRRDPELLLSGPAGTGKSLAGLQKLHLMASKYPGMRGLMLRKVRADMWESTMVTFQQKVLHPLDGVAFRSQEQEYRYPNGSIIAVAGLDRPGKVLSAEYDVAYVQQAEELLEDDWEKVTTRLRNWVLPYQQIIGDCNPDAPTHWLKKRCDSGQCVMLESRHEDNPTLFDGGQVTEQGAAYMAKLDALSGVRKLRLRFGQWAAAEGMVYGDDWDRARNLIDPFPIPDDWSRYWAIDFGYTNPFVWQAWAMDPDGRLYRYREIYASEQLVEDMADRIADLTQDEPRPLDIICDHDAEDRATLEKHLKRRGIVKRTRPANKAVSAGIDAVRARLRAAGDDKARLFLFRDALVQRDPLLVDARKPTCTEEEIDGYVYPTPKPPRPPDEKPVKENDHGLDCVRYVVATIDLRPSRRPVGF